MKTTLLLASVSLFSLVACGPPAAQFVGSWNGNGTLTVSGSDSAANTQQVSSDSVEIIDGASSDIVIRWNGCDIAANVSATVATVLPSFTCILNGGGETTQLVFSAGTATVMQDTINFNGAGNLTLTEGGQTATGTFNIQETMTKVGQK